MAITWSTNQDDGIAALATEIASALSNDKKVLWLVAGGSNIPIAVSILEKIKDTTSPEDLQHLTVSLTDERYGDVGHADSNWQQLLDRGFDGTGFKAIPVLRGESLEKTIASWSENLDAAISANDVCVGQFGIGEDGHIAGILPGSSATLSREIACGHDAEEFIRLTITFSTIRTLSTVYVFAFGAAKKVSLENLRNAISLEEQPVQILTELAHVHIYSDVSGF